jgi:hypothetical protein
MNLVLMPHPHQKNAEVKTMKTLKIGVMLLALLLAAMVIVPMVSATTTENEVSSATAQHVAETHMHMVAKNSETYAEWENGVLQPSTVYYNLMDRKSAYLFDVYVNGVYSGYVLTSATRDNGPILEYSRGKVPDAEPKTLLRSQSAVQSSIDTKTQKIGSPKLLYLGGTFYYAQYPVIDSQGKTVEVKTVDLHDSSVVNLTEQAKLHPLNAAEQLAHDTERAEKANQMWNSLELSNGTTSLAAAQVASATVGSKTIPGVPLYSQPLNNYCSPTSAAMVLSYWDSHGYSNIPDSSATLISELATAMGTSTNSGTPNHNVYSGMNSVSATHGYGSRLSFIEDNWITFSDVTTEINANKPFVLSMWGGGTAYGRSQAYGDHSVAVIGYESYSSGDYVVIQDTWTPLTAVSLSYNSWAGAIGAYSRPT